MASRTGCPGRAVAEPVMFALVGALNTLIDMAMFWLLVSFALHPLLANMVSYSTAAVNSYILNGHVTFRHRHAVPASAPSANRLLAFIAVKAVTLAISTACLSLALIFLPNLAAKAMSIGVTFAAAYVLTSRLVFVGAETRT